MDTSAFDISSGNHSLTFDCEFSNSGEEPIAKVEIRTFGNGETISLNSVTSK